MEKQRAKKIKTRWLILMLVGLTVLFAASGVVLHLTLGDKEEGVVHMDEQEEEKEEEVQTPGHVDISWYDDKKTDFTITTIQQLNGLSLLAMTYDFEGKNITLGADITMNEGDAAEWNKKEPDYFYTPIGKMEKPFKGNFDGQGHTISGLYCLREHTVSLFAFTQGSTIKNIRLVNSYFETTGLPVATKDLIGFTASIVGRSVGGTIENCYSNAHLVSVGMYNGGICAEVLNQTGNVIRNCWFDGSMNLTIQDGQKNWHVAGGVLGAVSEDVTIEHCLNTADITGTGCMVGGLIGWTAPGQTTVLKDCLNVGKVTAGSEQEWFQSGTVSYGRSQSVIKLEEVYTIKESNINYNVRSDRAIVEGAVNVFPEVKIKGIEGYKRTGLDFENYWVAVKDDTPELKEFSAKSLLETKGVAKASDYADISWYKEGKKTFTLKTIQQLNGLAYLANSNNFEGVTIKLGADIKMNEGNSVDWAKNAPDAMYTPIGSITCPFAGTFDGQGHTISGIYAKGEQQVGLFGWTSEKCTVRDFKITNSYFKSDGRIVASDNNLVYALVGSVAGVGIGKFDTIYSDAIVEGVGRFGGGLIGRTVNHPTTIKNCWFNGIVRMYNATEGAKNTGEIIGGLVGSMDGKTLLESCNFTGSVWGEGVMMGGFSGRILGAEGTIKGCLSTGTVQKDGTVGYMTCMAVGYVNTTGILTTEDSYVLYTGTTPTQYRKEEKTKINGSFTQRNAREDYVGLMTRASGLLGYNEWIITADLPQLKTFTSEKSLVDVSWYDVDKTKYQLDSIEDFYGFMLLGQTNNFEGKEIILKTDIAFNEGKASDWKTTAPKNAWRPVGNLNCQFAGTFDGQGHTISGIYAKGEQQIGLFGWTTGTSIIKNFELTNSYFKADGQIVASDANKVYSLVGSVAGVGVGKIANVKSDAIVEGVGAFGGGLVGRTVNFETTIKNCQFAGQVRMYNATIGAKNTGEIIGGIVGSMDTKTTLQSCNFIGSVWGEGVMMGGLAGRVLGGDATLRGCLSTGTVQEGGTVGYMTCMGVGYINTTGKLHVENTYILYTGTTGAQYRKEEKTEYTGFFTQCNSRTDYVGLTTRAIGLFQYPEWILTEELPELASFTEKKAIVDTSWYDADETKYKLKDIKDVYGFALISQHTNFAGKEIVLEDDITLNEGDASLWKDAAPNKVWISIGSSSCPFAGTFDGKNHTISGVAVGVSGQTTYAGLFGMINGGAVKNLKIKNSSFSGKHQVGSLAGVANNATFENIDVTAYVYASGGHVGGFFGQHLAGTLAMTDCHMLGGSVTSASTIAGGFIGTNDGTTTILADCSNSIAVQAAGTADDDNSSSQAGGFIGRAQGGNSTLTFTNCTNSGAINGTKANVGGFIGLAKGAGNVNIDKSTNKGKITSSTSNAGGFIGKFDNGGKTITITNSQNEGTISVNSSVAGGFIGFQWASKASIDASVNKGTITANSIDIGGFIAYPATGSVEITNSRNEANISSNAEHTGGFVGYGNQAITIKNSTNIGEITSTKKNVGGFVGIAYRGVTLDNCVNKGKIHSNTQNAGGFIGYNAENTATITNSKNEGNISANNYTVGGFVGNANDSVSISGSINSGNVSAGGQQVGGFVGSIAKSKNASLALTIEKSKNTGSITASTGNVGGFAGQAYDVAQITVKESENAGAVTCNGTGTNVGGFIGWFKGTTLALEHCLNSGKIKSANHFIGGMVGNLEAGGSIDNCLNTGVIETTSHAKGAILGRLNGGKALTIADTYASIESCTNQIYSENNQTINGNKVSGGPIANVVTAVSAANIKGAVAKTNAPKLDWDSKWVTSEGFPLLRCFEPVVVQTKVATQKPTLYQSIVNVLKSIF